MSIDSTKLYYKTWTNDIGWNMRLEFLPANHAAGSLSTSNYVHLGASLMTIKSTKFSFKDTPIGAPDAPVMTVEFDYGELPSNMQEALLSPQADSQGDGDLGMMMQVDGTSASTTTIPVSNIVRLFSDRGDAGGAPTGASLTSGGSTYVTATGLSTTTTGAGTGATIDVTAIYDAVATYTLTFGGTSGYTGAHNMATTGGTGTGCQVSCTDTGGVITSIDSLDAGGDGYTIGDTLTIVGGTNDATFTVDTVTGTGTIASFVMHGGTGYAVFDEIHIVGGDNTAYVTVSAVSSAGLYCEFMGAQSTEYGGKLGVDSTGAITGRLEITFYDLLKTALENTQAATWANTIFRNKYYRTFGGAVFPGGTVCASDNVLGRADVFVDLAYYAPYETFHSATLSQHATHGTPQLTGEMFSVSKCFGEITQLLMRRVLPQWQRPTTLNAGTITVTNSPISHITFYKQDYTRLHKRGTALSESSIGFIGALVNADADGAPTSTTWMNDSTQRLAGMLVADKNDESFIKGSLWDTLKDICENFGCKLQWYYTAHQDANKVYYVDVSLLFNPPLTRNVTGMTDLESETNRTEGEWYDYSPCVNVISDATVEVKNLQGIDQASFKAVSAAPKAKARIAVPLSLHNHPTIWDGSNDNASALGVQSLYTPRRFEKIYIGLSLRKLWYFEASSTSPYDDSSIFTATQRVFKVHEVIDYYAGNLGSTTVQYSYNAIDDGGSAPNVNTLSVHDAPRPLPGEYVRMQQNALGNAIAQSLVTMFGDLKQSLITRTFQMSATIFGYAVGDQVNFTAPTGSPIPVHSAHSQGYLLTMEADFQRGTVKCDILTSGI